MTLNSNKRDLFIHPTALIDEDVTIGEETKIWHFSHVLSGSKIGKKCNFGQNVVVGPDVTIGDGCKVQNNVSIYKGVTLENDVFCGPSVVFTNVFNPRSRIKRMSEIRCTLVKEGATLGANSTIVCGVTIGRYAFVGAGAVVTKDVPDYALVVGNPAIVSGWVCECGEKLNGMTCTVCQKQVKSEMPNMEFVDLKAQQRRILPDIKNRINIVLEHGKFIMGPEVLELERQLASFVKVKHAITCASGTDALVMALMALEIGPGDAVFTTPFTFVATAEAIRLVGATPVFVDIEPNTYNISPEKLSEAINKVKNNGSLYAKAVVPVDLFGLPCNYDDIKTISSEYGLHIIEDAAQAFGASYRGEMAGSLGDVGCTSFFPAKPLGCYGDGGALFTNSDELADKLISIRIHGKGENKYDNVRLGVNGRLDTIQAAILLAKLNIFPWELKKRRELAYFYSNAISSQKLPIVVPEFSEEVFSAWAQYSVLTHCENSRSMIVERLNNQGVPSAIYYPKPLHLQSAYTDLGFEKGAFPISEDYSSRILSLPMHPYLDVDDLSKVIECLT